MKRLTTTQNPITKVTQTFQRADGSEARITATQDAIFGGKTHITVERRGGPDELWRECSKLPHPDWREMSVDEYTQRGRPEHLQTVTFAEMVKTTALLGRDLDQAVDEGLAAYAPGQAPAVRRDATLAEHVEHYLQAVRNEIDPAVFVQGQHHALARTLQEFFGGELVAIIRPAAGDSSSKWVSTACKINDQNFDIHGAWSGTWSAESYRSEGLEPLAIYGAQIGTLIQQHSGETYGQELAARLRAIGRREIQVTVEQGTAPDAQIEDSVPDSNAPMAERIEHYLSAVREELGSDQFEDGQCHALAITLQKLFGGDLYAILLHEVDEEGERFSTTYSHMICEIENQCYDIGGAEADERWCARWPDEPDADGLTSEFEYVAIAPDELAAFLEKHRAKPVDQELATRLRAIYRQADPELAEQVGPRLPCPPVIDPWEDGGPGAR